MDLVQVRVRKFFGENITYERVMWHDKRKAKVGATIELGDDTWVVFAVYPNQVIDEEKLKKRNRK